MSILLVAPLMTAALGYRAVVAASSVLAASASVLFAIAVSVPELFAARILQGSAVGATSAALTATLTALEPRRRAHIAAMVTTAAIACGGGLGPVVSGAIAEHVPWPTHTIYLAHAALLMLLSGATLSIPRTLGVSDTAHRTVGRPTFPIQGRLEFRRACVEAFLAWAIVGLFLSVAPTILSLNGAESLFLSGAVSGCALVISAAVQILVPNTSVLRNSRTGPVAVGLGAVLLVIAALRGQPLILVAAGLCAGVGHGFLFSRAGPPCICSLSWSSRRRARR